MSIGWPLGVSVTSVPFTVSTSVPATTGASSAVQVGPVMAKGSPATTTSSPGCTWNVALPRPTLLPGPGVALKGAELSTAVARRA